MAGQPDREVLGTAGVGAPDEPKPSPVSQAAAGRGWLSLLTVARASFDAAVIVAAAVVAFLTRFGLGWFGVTESADLNFSSHLIASLVWVVALLWAMALNRLYDEDTLFPGAGELPRVLRSVVEAVAVLSVFVYFTKSFSVSRSWFALLAILSFAFLFVERSIIRRSLRRERRQGRFRRPVVLLSRGAGEQLETMIATLPEFSIRAHLHPAEGGEMPDAVLREPQADIVISGADFEDAELWRIVIEAGRGGRSVFVHSSVRSVRRDRLTVRELGGRTLVKVAPPFLSGRRALQKRGLDIAVSALALVIGLPFMLLIGLMILVTSGWPVLYRQERLGSDGRPFVMWKFRTMRPRDESEETVEWTTEADARRTPIGGVLRRFSLDELPQLWNVFRGDMSMVGPRPERAVLVSRFDQEIDWYRYRHRIRPGLTGWAQVHGWRGDTALDPRVDHDNWYIENWSLALDCKILLRTLGELLRGRNAY